MSLDWVRILNKELEFKKAYLEQYKNIWATYPLAPNTKKKYSQFGLSGSLSFSIRADLKLKPLIIIIPLAGLTVIIFGYIVRNIERGYKSTD